MELKSFNLVLKKYGKWFWKTCGNPGYRQIISSRLYVRFKGTCLLAGRALLNIGE